MNKTYFVILYIIECIFDLGNTSLLDGGLKWVNFVIITVEKQGQWLCFGYVL